MYIYVFLRRRIKRNSRAAVPPHAKKTERRLSKNTAIHVVDSYEGNALRKNMLRVLAVSKSYVTSMQRQVAAAM